jgi:hypothetical protein
MNTLSWGAVAKIKSKLVENAGASGQTVFNGMNGSVCGKICVPSDTVGENAPLLKSLVLLPSSHPKSASVAHKTVIVLILYLTFRSSGGLWIRAIG